jgi:hypothetical protein
MVIIISPKIYFVCKALQEWIIAPLNPVPPFTYGHIYCPTDLSFEYKKICEAVVLKMIPADTDSPG